MGGKSGSTKANNACFLDNLADLLRGETIQRAFGTDPFRPFVTAIASMTIAVTSPPVGWAGEQSPRLSGQKHVGGRNKRTGFMIFCPG